MVSTVYTYLRKVTVSCFLLSLVTLCQTQSTSYPIKDLADYCGNSDLNTAATTILLPCAITGYGRAGKLNIYTYRYLSTSCNVTLTVDGQSCPGEKTYAIYFNIRDLGLALEDRIDVYENSTLVKLLPGGYQYNPYNRNPTSFGQLLSRYSRTPTLNLRFLKNSTRIQSHAYGITTLDYVVLREDYDQTKETPCKALGGGSLLDAHYCEQGDRINCPSTYIPQIGLNPVSRTELGNTPSFLFPNYCYQYGTTTTSYPMYTSNYRPRPTYNNNLSGEAIAGIICGSVFAFIFILTVCLRISHATNGRPGTGSQTAIANGRNVPIVGPYPGHHRHQQQQQQSPVAYAQRGPTGLPLVSMPLPAGTRSESFLGAPPAYESVCSPVSATETSQDAAKY